MATMSSFRVRSRRGLVATTTTKDEENPEWVGQQDNVIVTNCDTEGCDTQSPHILFDPTTKIPMEYTCFSAWMADDNVVTTNSTIDDEETVDGLQPQDLLAESFVRVDYEALLPLDDAVDVEHNERQLQWRILLAAVEDLGLDTCDFSHQRQPVAVSKNTVSTRRRTLTQQQQNQGGLDSSLTIFAVQNDFFLSAAYQNPCQYLSGEEASYQCIPIRTVLRLRYVGDANQTDVVQAYVKNLLHRSMVDQTHELMVGDVTDLYYVGTHDFSAVVAPEGDTGELDARHSRTNHNSNAVMTLASSLISASAAIVLLVLLVVVRRRRQQRDNNEEDADKEDRRDDYDQKSSLSVVAFPKRRHDSSSSFQHPPPPPDFHQELESDFTAATATTTARDGGQKEYGASKSGTGSPTHSISSDEAHADDEGNDNHLDDVDDYDDVDIVTMDNVITSIFRPSPETATTMTDSSTCMLPPRPPHHRPGTIATRTTITGNAMRLRRRKKKKNNRPMSLQRTNSRECIQTMEAIPEVLDDHSTTSSNEENDDDEEEEEEREESDIYSTGDEDDQGSPQSSYSSSSSGQSTPTAVSPDSPLDSRRSSPTTRRRFPPGDPEDTSDAVKILDSIHFQWTSPSSSTAAAANHVELAEGERGTTLRPTSEEITSEATGGFLVR